MSGFLRRLALRAGGFAEPGALEPRLPSLFEPADPAHFAPPNPSSFEPAGSPLSDPAGSPPFAPAGSPPFAPAGSPPFAPAGSPPFAPAGSPLFAPGGPSLATPGGSVPTTALAPLPSVVDADPPVDPGPRATGATAAADDRGPAGGTLPPATAPGPVLSVAASAGLSAHAPGAALQTATAQLTPTAFAPADVAPQPGPPVRVEPTRRGPDGPAPQKGNPRNAWAGARKPAAVFMPQEGIPAEIGRVGPVPDAAAPDGSTPDGWRLVAGRVPRLAPDDGVLGPRNARHARPDQAAPQEPVVRVTIGRIEVHAAHPGRTAESPAPDPDPEPQISLDEYLAAQERP